MKILIADDHRLVADGIGALLTDSFSMTRISVCYSLHEAQTLLEQKGWIEVCLLDFKMPGMNEEPLVRRFLKQSGHRPVILMSGEASLLDIEWARDVGFSAFLPKTLDGPAFVRRIQDVCINSAHDAEFFGDFSPARTPGHRKISRRELDIVQLVKLGISNKEIADIAQVSPETVKAHLKALQGKFGARSRTDLVVKAVAEGYIRV